MVLVFLKELFNMLKRLLNYIVICILTAVEIFNLQIQRQYVSCFFSDNRLRQFQRVPTILVLDEENRLICKSLVNYIKVATGEV